MRTWPEPQPVADDVRLARELRVHVEQELDFLLERFLAHQEKAVRDGLLQVERHELEIELVGLDLGEIEDVVDDAEQRLRRVVDLGDVVLLPRVELRLEREIGHADDRVHRRADLVAHVGEEHRLRLGRRLGGARARPAAPRETLMRLRDVLLDRGGHVVERLGDGVQLGDRLAGVDARRVVAFGDAVRARGDAPDRAQHRLVDEERARDREQQQHEHRRACEHDRAPQVIGGAFCTVAAVRASAMSVSLFTSLMSAGLQLFVFRAVERLQRELGMRRRRR